MWLLISFLALAGLTAVPAAVAQERLTVLEVGLLIDGSGGEPIKDAVIVMEGKRVKAVGRKGAIKIPQGARVVQAGDKTAFPGLIDSHVHYKDWQGELYLNHGVTTALVIGSEPIEWIVAQKEGIAKGKIVGPRIFAAGPHLNSPREGERRRSARDEISRLRFEVQAKNAEEARKPFATFTGRARTSSRYLKMPLPKSSGLRAKRQRSLVYLSGDTPSTFTCPVKTALRSSSIPTPSWQPP